MLTTPMTRRLAPVLFVALLVASAVQAQDTEGLSIQVEPASLTLQVGETGHFTAKVIDAAGAVQEQPLFFFSLDRRAVSVTSEGDVEALLPGEYQIFVGSSQDFYVEVPVTVAFPPVARVAFAAARTKVYQGTRVPLPVEVVDAAGALRDNVDVHLSSSDPAVASVDAFHRLTAHKAGTVTVTADAEGVQGRIAVEVVPNPIVRVTLRGGAEQARTGDVLAYEAVATDAAGNVVADAPVVYAVEAEPDDDLGPAASAQIGQDGRFVAETPGLYTVVATSGSLSAQQSVRISPRNVQRALKLVGQGLVSDVKTSDLWVWQGVDGRDYAVTGTHTANGEAYFWDVSDPATPTIIDTVTVDARTVNDVKVSEDGSLCIISREGASSRRNGIVLLDCTNPYDVKVISEYTEHLTGGVHNLFIYQNHVFALSAGQRYDIINIDDPKQPHRVGSFELDTPGHSIHDVWVVDGIAYSSNWGDGVVMVDVGNGIAGGSPSNPVLIGKYAYPSGWNHAAFPYKSKDTGKFYILAGDEAFPGGVPAGWVHFIDFTDPQNPKEVARYEVPEAGTHNLWVEDDKLYVAYYQGGLRVVDLSGDLMGDLYRQGREIARFRSADPDGFVPNSPMAWGPQPYKGHIFFSDFHSGLWVVKLEGGEEEPKPGL